MMSPGEKLVFVLPVLLLTPFIVVAAVLPGVVNSQLGLRAKANEEGTGYTVYRVRLAARLPAALFGLLLGADFVREVHLHEPLRWFALVLLELTVLVLLPQRIVLDDQGIHSFRFLHRPLTISWSDLEDVKTRGTKSNFFSDATYRFRSATGTSIAVDEWAFETDDLLRRVRLRHPCPEIKSTLL